MKFRLLIPAAGASRRFQEAGVHTPKPDLVIEWNGARARMLDHVLGFVDWSVLSDHAAVAMNPSMNGPDKWSVRRFNVRKTRGQAHTLLQLIRRACPLDTPVLVMNADMIIEPYWMRATCEAVMKGADFSALVTQSERRDVSYVDKVPYPTHFHEKDRIGEHAMVGAWAFRSSDMLREALTHACVEMYEPFLSHALNAMRGVCYAVESPDTAVDLGTPEALGRANARIVE